MYNNLYSCKSYNHVNYKEMGVCMGKVISFIAGHFSGYTFALILFCSYMLIFIDRKHLKSKGLKKESRFAFIAGILYVLIAVTGFLITKLSSTR
jgi:hypothetical protein